MPQKTSFKPLVATDYVAGETVPIEQRSQDDSTHAELMAIVMNGRIEASPDHDRHEEPGYEGTITLDLDEVVEQGKVINRELSMMHTVKQTDINSREEENDWLTVAPSGLIRVYTHNAQGKMVASPKFYSKAISDAVYGAMERVLSKQETASKIDAANLEILREKIVDAAKDGRFDVNEIAAITHFAAAIKPVVKSK